MPTHEYVCWACGKEFKIVRVVVAYDTKKVYCPRCGSTKVDRRWSTIAAETPTKS